MERKARWKEVLIIDDDYVICMDLDAFQASFL